MNRHDQYVKRSEYERLTNINGDPIYLKIDSIDAWEKWKEQPSEEHTLIYFKGSNKVPVRESFNEVKRMILGED